MGQGVCVAIGVELVAQAGKLGTLLAFLQLVDDAGVEGSDGAHAALPAALAISALARSIRSSWFLPRPVVYRIASQMRTTSCRDSSMALLVARSRSSVATVPSMSRFHSRHAVQVDVFVVLCFVSVMISYS